MPPKWSKLRINTEKGVILKVCERDFSDIVAPLALTNKFEPLETGTSLG